MTAPVLTIDTATGTGGDAKKVIKVSGTVEPEGLASLKVYIDGDEVVEGVGVVKGSWYLETELAIDVDWSRVRPEEKRVPDLSKCMVIVVAKGSNGRSTAEMVFV